MKTVFAAQIARGYWGLTHYETSNEWQDLGTRESSHDAALLLSEAMVRHGLYPAKDDLRKNSRDLLISDQITKVGMASIRYEQ